MTALAESSSCAGLIECNQFLLQAELTGKAVVPVWDCLAKSLHFNIQGHLNCLWSVLEVHIYLGATTLALSIILYLWLTTYVILSQFVKPRITGEPLCAHHCLLCTLSSQCIGGDGLDIGRSGFILYIRFID